MVLPTIAKLVSVVREEIPNLEFDKVVFVSVQHLLYTTLDIFKGLMTLGAKPENIFLLGKHYSNCQDVIDRAHHFRLQVQTNAPLEELGTYREIMETDISRMWNEVLTRLKTNTNIDTVVVLDDGGRLLTSIPEVISNEYNVIGVEQTTEGVRRLSKCNLPFAYVDVANSAAKTLEACMVAGAIVDKIASKLPAPNENMVCGVAGLGFIGAAVAKKLFHLGYNVLMFDINTKVTKDGKVRRVNAKNFKFGAINKMININDNANSSVFVRKGSSDSLFDLMAGLKRNKKWQGGSLKWMGSFEELIDKSDYIFGCTGHDITTNLDIENVFKGNKHLISCSSEDKEFFTLLKHIQEKDPQPRKPLEDVHWQMNADTHVCLIKGGFPCNFDNTGTSVPTMDIQLTRALIFGGLIQSLAMLPSCRRNAIRNQIMLDPHMQKFIVLAWLESIDFDLNFANNYEQNKRNVINFDDPQWIIRTSGGLYHKVSYFTDAFNNAFETVAEFPSASHINDESFNFQEAMQRTLRKSTTMHDRNLISV